jgi:predicted nucleic-acid-binding Zn-ribbon protein
MSHCPKCEAVDLRYDQSRLSVDRLTGVKFYSIDQFTCMKCGWTFEAGMQPFSFNARVYENSKDK